MADIAPRVHPAGLAEAVLLAECQQTRTRRSGPGGQHRNKVESAIVLEHTPTGVRVEASERRSQSENLSVAIGRLRLELALQVRYPPLDEPSALWTSRCGQGRISISVEHVDFPALLAEALDVIAARGFDVKAAAEHLASSTSQLVRFLNDEPRALAWVNVQRVRLGLRRLMK